MTNMHRLRALHRHQAALDRVERQTACCCHSDGATLLERLNVFVVTTARTNNSRLMRELQSFVTFKVQYGGVDLNNASSFGLFESRQIGIGGALAIDEGRARHHDVATVGAVGCWQSHMMAIRASDPDAHTLVLEDDVALERPNHFFGAICRVIYHNMRHRRLSELHVVALAPLLVRGGPSWNAKTLGETRHDFATPQEGRNLLACQTRLLLWHGSDAVVPGRQAASDESSPWSASRRACALPCPLQATLAVPVLWFHFCCTQRDDISAN